MDAPKPIEAVEATWNVITNLQPGEKLIVHPYNKEKMFRAEWNGWMWETFPVLDDEEA